MNRIVSKSIRGTRRDAPSLQCNIVVEPSGIDFLTEGANFVAGSDSNCGCFISPMPEQQKRHRRSPALNKR